MRLVHVLGAAVVASGALWLAASPAGAATAGVLSITPDVGYVDTAVRVRSTCPAGSTSATISLFSTSATGHGGGATAPVATDGTWHYEGALFATVTASRVWFVANCRDADGSGVQSQEPGWTFYVDDDVFYLEGHTPPHRPSPTPTPVATSQKAAESPSPSPVRTTPARAAPSSAAPTSAAPSPPASSPVETPTDGASGSPPAEPTPTSAESATTFVTLTSPDDPGLNAVVVVGGGAGALSLAGASGALWFRRRRSRGA